MTVEQLARDLNRLARRKGGLTGYVYQENEKTDVAQLAAALREMKAEIVATLSKLLLEDAQ